MEGSYLGQLGHEGAVLQPEVFLLAVQLPLQHLRFAQQRFHFLQQPPTRRLALKRWHSKQKTLQQGELMSKIKKRKRKKTNLSFLALIQSLRKGEKTSAEACGFTFNLQCNIFLNRISQITIVL